MTKHKRLWIWVTVIVSNLVFLIAGLWYLPPKIWPEWTIKNSPFFEQQVMCINPRTDFGMDRGAFIRERCFNTGMIAPSLFQTENSRLIDLMSESINSADGASLSSMFNYIERLCYGSNDLDLFRGVLIGEAMRRFGLRAESEEALGKLAEINPDYALDAVFTFSFNRIHLSERSVAAIEAIDATNAPGASFSSRFIGFSRINFLIHLKDRIKNGKLGFDDLSLISICLNSYVSDGYDHVTPGKYRVMIGEMLRDLLQMRAQVLDDPGRQWADYAVCKLYCLTRDLELKTVVEEIIDSIKRDEGRPFSAETMPIICAYEMLRATGDFNLPQSYFELNESHVANIEKDSFGQRLAYALACQFAGEPCAFSSKLFSEYLAIYDFQGKPLTREGLAYFVFLSYLVSMDPNGAYERQINWFYQKVFDKVRCVPGESVFGSENRIQKYLPDYNQPGLLILVSYVISLDKEWAYIRRRELRR